MSEYLEKYSIAPPPSRDYYGIKVVDDQVILLLWKISHGPHMHPVVRITRFHEFDRDKAMQNDVQHVFGRTILRYVKDVVEGSGSGLLMLPKNILKRLTAYLGINDVSNLSAISTTAKEVFRGDTVWEVLYRRHKRAPISREEKDRASTYGWRQLFKERHVPNTSKDGQMAEIASKNRLPAKSEGIRGTSVEKPREDSTLSANKLKSPTVMSGEVGNNALKSNLTRKKSDSELEMKIRSAINDCELFLGSKSRDYIGAKDVGSESGEEGIFKSIGFYQSEATNSLRTFLRKESSTKKPRDEIDDRTRMARDMALNVSKSTGKMSLDIGKTEPNARKTASEILRRESGEKLRLLSALKGESKLLGNRKLNERKVFTDRLSLTRQGELSDTKKNVYKTEKTIFEEESVISEHKYSGRRVFTKESIYKRSPNDGDLKNAKRVDRISKEFAKSNLPVRREKSTLRKNHTTPGKPVDNSSSRNNADGEKLAESRKFSRLKVNIAKNKTEMKKETGV